MVYRRIYKHIPNALTLLRILSGPLLWHVIMVRQQAAAFFLITFAILSDFGDGYLARRLFITSRAGCFLDPLADKVVIWCSFAALCAQQTMPWWVLAVIVARDVCITWLRSFMVARGLTLRTTFFAKAKTAVQFASLYIFILLQGKAAGAVYGLSLMVALLTVLSAASYLRVLLRFATRRGR